MLQRYKNKFKEKFVSDFQPGRDLVTTTINMWVT
jgi:hypothetical protein